MKKNFTLRTRFLLFLFGLFYSCFSVFSQTVGGQCGNFTAKVTTTGSICGKNGSITVVLSGPDIEGTNPNYSDIQYRAFITGTDPKDVKWGDQNVIPFLAPGKYTVQVQGKCKEASGGMIPKDLTFDVQVTQIGAWRELGDMTTVVNYHPIADCIKGQVTISNLTGGIPPYKIEIVKAPVGDSRTVIYSSATSLPSGGRFVIGDLMPGTYEFLFTEGSSCASTKKQTVVINQLPMPTVSQLIASYIYPEGYANSSIATGCGFTIYRSSASDDYVAHREVWDKLFEYHIYYPGDNISNPNSLAWSAFPANSAYLRITNPRYTISQIQQNPANYKPSILIRAKGCSAVLSLNLTLRESPYFYTSSTYYRYADCGKTYFSLYMWRDYDGTFCWPYTWVLKDSNKNTVDSSVNNGGPITWQNTRQPEIGPLSAGDYTFTFTDAGGFTWDRSLSIAAAKTAATDITTSTNSTTGISHSWGCNNEWTPFFYVNSSSGNAKALSRVQYLRTEKSVNNGPYAVDPSFQAPDFPDIDIASLPANANNYIFPWAKSKAAILRSYYPSTDPEIAKLKSEATTFDFGQEKNRYVHYFQVTDTCGKTNTISIYSPSIYYEREEEPTYNVENLCNGFYKITFPNVQNTLRTKYRDSASTGSSAYMSIVQKPTGAQASYYNATGTSTTYDVITSPTQYIEVNKPGRYLVTLSNYPYGTSSQYYLDNYFVKNCMSTFEVIIEEPKPFKIDVPNTAIYRCPGSEKGEGYLAVAVENGSGDYYFELYDENRNLIAENTTGIFDWTGAINSDSYIIKAYDLYCAPNSITSTEQGITVRDLSNRGTAWSLQPNVCVGDDIVLEALALSPTEYKWYSIDEDGEILKDYSGPSRIVVIPNADLKMNGRYVSEVTVPGCSGTVMRDTINISVGEKLMYWNPDAVDSNWFNTDNWLKVESGGVADVSTIPAPCTTVHIPGNARNYPNLHESGSPWDDFGYPACDTIVYHHGAATAYPGYLTYKRAIVQYDFGYYGDDNLEFGDLPFYIKDRDHDVYPNVIGGEKLPVLQRSQWYMLATPLKYMAGGDFGLAGYPKIYQRLFNTTQEDTGKLLDSGFTTSFAKNAIDTRTTGNALALWLPDYDDYIGSRDHKVLENLHGVIEIPFCLNESILKYRPADEYNVADSTSIFYMFNKNSLEIEKDQFETFKRGYQSYRFVFENENNGKELIQLGDKEYVSVYRQILPEINSGTTQVGMSMIGNPFMGHISFDKLYELNKDKIKPYYQIVDGKTEQTMIYNVHSPLNGELDGIIAPLQAFIVEETKPELETEIIYYLDGDKSVMVAHEKDEPFGKVRSAMSADKLQGFIKVSCIVPEALLKGEEVKTSAGLTFNYSDVTNVPKSIFDTGSDMTARAEVAIMGTSDADILYAERVVNTPAKPAVVKLGVYTKNTSKDLRLPIQIEGNLIKSVRFVDKKEGKEISNIPNGWEYVFKQKQGVKDLSKDGLDLSRFELHIEYYAETEVGIEDIEASDLYVSYQSGYLLAESSLPMESVKVINMSGVTVVDELLSGVTNYRRGLEVPSGVYLVQVGLYGGSVETRKLIIE